MAEAIIAILIVTLINAFFAALMRTVAFNKGYHRTPVFALVFFFGIFGMLYIMALPDLVARQQQKNILDVLYAINKRQEQTDAPVSSPISTEALNALDDLIKCNKE